MIYDFDNGHLDRHFRKNGIQKRNVDSMFKLIKNIDFSKQLDLGKAILDSSGAYVIGDDGERKPVYFYKSQFWFYYGDDPNIKYPRFHILKCETINAHSGFTASNSKTAIVINKNRSKGEKQYEIEMKLCRNCAKLASNPHQTTAEFFEANEKKYNATKSKKSEIKIDLDGYTLDWSRVSKKYRNIKKFKCESCSIELNQGRRFLHVHHKNHDKRDNRNQNLECLCVLCHKHQDSLHELNFEVGKMKRQVNKFLEKYREELIQCGNPYINLYTKD